ncbi:glycosyltransferase family 4 protein [Afipia sp. DC4300-2b1]|uniref:glycosyltransferase family 4 protein n=1 Tax=Afipia sp. DC4300-2b1 TaxID=2804672 RepID=UPI003CF9494B
MIAGMQAGGAERVMAQLCNHLAKKGHEVALVTLSPASEISFYDVSSAVQRCPLGRFVEGSGVARIVRVVAWIAALRRTIAALRPDVVISFVDLTNVMVLLAIRGLKIPVIVSERIDPTAHSYRLSWLDRALRRLTYPYAARIVVQTRRAARFFEHSPTGKIVTIPNPVPFANVASYPDRVSPEGRFRIIGIGRLDHQKGFDILIDSFATLATRFPDWDVVIFGQGPDRPTLLDRIAFHGLDGRIKLMGISRDIAGETARSHILAFPSRYEGFPNALAEAMAVGLPTVAFEDVSGVEDLVVSGESGILVRSVQLVSGNSNELFAEALAQLMTAPQLRLKMGQAAKTRAETFQPEIVFRQWDRLIATVPYHR